MNQESWRAEVKRNMSGNNNRVAKLIKETSVPGDPITMEIIHQCVSTMNPPIPQMK
jgi:hypothetical protein